jgi:hypothetical protein
MSQFLNLIDALATHINAGNLEGAISFVEKMISLVESLKAAGVAPAPVAPVVPPVVS